MYAAIYIRMKKYLDEELKKRSRAKITIPDSPKDNRKSSEIVGYGNQQLDAVFQSQQEVRRARETWRLKGM